MVIRQRRRLAPLGVAVALLLTAGVVYAATTTLSTPTSVGGSQQAVSSPCTNVGVTYSPTYSTTDGSYGFSSISFSASCPTGTYLAAIAIGTGGSTYVEKIAEIAVPAGGSTTVSLALASRIRVADLTNIAVFVSRLD